MKPFKKTANSFMAGILDREAIQTIVSPNQPWCKFGVRDPVILTNATGLPVKFDGNYRLFFSGRNRDMSEGGVTKVGWAKSKDLINWQVDPVPVFSDGDYAASASILEVDDGLFRIYYSFDTLKGYRYAETRDFKSWQFNEPPLLSPNQFNCLRIGLPHVFERDGLWYMLGEGFNNGFSLIGALSVDGKTWEPLASGETLYPSREGNWDRGAQANPAISHSRKFPELVLYNGNSAFGAWDIGVLTTTEPLRDVYKGLSRPLLTRVDVGSRDGRLEGGRLVKTDKGHLLFYFLLPGMNSFAGGTIHTLPVEDSILNTISGAFRADQNRLPLRENMPDVSLKTSSTTTIETANLINEKARNLASEEAANDRLAEKYFAIWDTQPIQKYTNYQEGIWLRQLVNPGERILLLGSGGGREIENLISMDIDITAFDLSQKMLDAGRERFPHDNIKWVKGDAQEPPNDLGEFDHIIALGLVFCYLASPEKAAKAMMRHLVPGGTIVIGVANSEHFSEKIARRALADGRVRNGFSCDELSELLLAAGFENPQVIGHRFFVDGLPAEINRALADDDSRKSLIEDFIKIEERMIKLMPAKAAKQLWATAIRPV